MLKCYRNVGVPLESIATKENALFLFHMLGKVLYNKRACFCRISVLLAEALCCLGKGDPPPSHATKREAAALRELDARLKDQPPLPSWHTHEARKTSRVSADVRTHCSCML
jgi:cell cycle checkpoint protein